MRSTAKYFCLVAIAGLIIFPALVTKSAATAVPDFILTPATLEYKLDPGQTQQAKITLVNNTARERDFEIHLVSFASGDDHGRPQLDAAIETPLHAWLQFPEKFTLKANSHADYEFSIVVPPTADPGSYRTVVLFRDTAAAPDESGSAITSQTGPLLFVTVTGEVHESAAVSGFGVTRGVFETLPVDFTVTFVNQGNVDIAPSGVINITPQAALGSQDAIKFDFNPSGARTLADTTRAYTSQWRDDQLRMGYYKAEIVVAYGQTNQIATAAVYFWVLPWKLLGGILFVFLAVAIVMRIRSRNPEV